MSIVLGVLRRRFVPLAVGVLSALLCLLIVTDWLPILRGPAPETDQWYWPYWLRPTARWGPALLVGALLATAGWLWLRAPLRRSVDRMALIGLVTLHLLWQLGFVYADASRPWETAAQAATAELIDRTLPPVSAGFFWTAAHLPDLNAALRDYPALMAAFESDHARTHPPGLVALNWLTIRAWDGGAPAVQAAAWAHTLRCTDLWLFGQPPQVAAALLVWSVLPLLAGAATILPAYGFARTLSMAEPQQTARLAALLTAAIPSAALFAPKSVQLYAPLTVAIGWLWWAALRAHGRRALALAGTAGLLYSCASFLSVGNATLALFLGLFGLLALGWTDWRRTAVVLARAGGAFAAAALVVWGVYALGWGVWPWEIIRRALDEHYQIVGVYRPYGVWAVHNLVDLVIYGGAPLWLGVIGATWSGRRGRGAAWAAAAALLLFVAALTASGSVRGEAGRIWLFFMPLAAVAAAPWLRAQRAGQSAYVGALALTAALGLAWRSERPVIVVAQPPTSAEAWTPAQTRNDRFGPTIALTGAALEQTATALTVRLLWTALDRTPTPYTGFVHLLDTDGRLAAQQDNWPVEGTWPPTCWQPGEQVTDAYRVALDGLPPGAYQVWVGLYDARDLTPAGPPVQIGTLALPPR